MVPSVGRTVHVKIDSSQAAQINRLRALGEGRFGNEAKEGDVLAMEIVRVWNTDPGSCCVNGQIKTDGNFVLWVTSVVQGTGLGQWFEPPRV